MSSRTTELQYANWTHDSIGLKMLIPLHRTEGPWHFLCACEWDNKIKRAALWSIGYFAFFPFLVCDDWWVDCCECRWLGGMKFWLFQFRTHPHWSSQLQISCGPWWKAGRTLWTGLHLYHILGWMTLSEESQTTKIAQQDFMLKHGGGVLQQWTASQKLMGYLSIFCKFSKHWLCFSSDIQLVICLAT